MKGRVRMFNNIGGKIKDLASAMAIIGIIASFVLGFVLFGIDDDMIPVGIVIIVVGSLISWIGSFLLYGFGELIEKTCIIEERLALNPQMQSARELQSAQNERNAALKELLKKGVISEEEYREALRHE